MTQLVTKIVVGSEHPSLPGHFPGNPIVPGVVLLDLILTEIQAALPQTTHLRAVPNAKFLRPVTPNEIVDVGIAISDGEHSLTLRARFQATVAGAPVAAGVYLLAIDAPGANES